MLEAWFGWPALGLLSLLMVMPMCLALVWLARRRVAPPATLSAAVSPGTSNNESFEVGDEVAGAGGSRANLALFQQKRREWQIQLELGELPAATYAELLAESRQQLLAEIDAMEVPVVDQEGGVASTVPRAPSQVPQLATSLIWQRALLGVTALLIPLLAYLLYLPAGYSLGAADQQAVATQLELIKRAPDTDARRRAVQQLLDALALQTRSLAPDPQLLRLHAEVLLSAGRYQPVMRVYQRMLERAPDDAGIIAQLAETHYLQASASQAANSGPAAFSPRASELLDRALALDPQQPRALGLAGIRAFERRQWQQSIQWWQRAAAVVAPGSQQRSLVDSGIAAARARLAAEAASASTGPGGEHLQPVAQTNRQAGAAELVESTTHFVKLAISVDPAQLRASDSASTPVFVFARPADGSRMPLAAKRLQLGDLPTTIVMTERDKMAGRSIADVTQVVVGARLARSGQPIAAAGDIESAALTVAVQRGGGGREISSENNSENSPESIRARIEAAPLHRLHIERSRE